MTGATPYPGWCLRARPEAPGIGTPRIAAPMRLAVAPLSEPGGVYARG